MPEMTFVIEWPNGTSQSCYSPSLVMHDHLEAGKTYPIAEFLARTRTALNEASERVRAKFGYYCSSAADQLTAIERTAAQFEQCEFIRVVSMTPALVVANTVGEQQ
ncbi:MSMEG_0570 family nitrogen starvation response protein [Nocardia sp. CA-120079]|uniref:MSMEG_0570 family nitrogen starvation response protein n=1 Tax=Nocardia sp. CA-120079 TaxID=3239974 RepID=UPI003D99DB9C